MLRLDSCSEVKTPEVSERVLYSVVSAQEKQGVDSEAKPWRTRPSAALEDSQDNFRASGWQKASAVWGEAISGSPSLAPGDAAQVQSGWSMATSHPGLPSF